MKPSSGDTILIGAVLERMGSAQAQVLLDQVKTWLSQRHAHRETSKPERRRKEAVIHEIQPDIALQTQEDN